MLQANAMPEERHMVTDVQDEPVLQILVKRLEQGLAFLANTIPQIEDKVIALRNDGPIGSSLIEQPQDPLSPMVKNSCVVSRLSSCANRLENTVLKLEALRKELNSIV